MMWGADTPLVVDALQIAAVAALLAGGTVFAAFRLRRNKTRNATPSNAKGSLEERVQVLERIATDRSQDLADEIDQLRDIPSVRGPA
ncbi:MAG: hypothetical protein QNJ15_09185 [Erythrobacter sp.]|nr:hypothetical protein [Erythrobacter sp.]